MKILGLLYGQYSGQHRGQPPANEAQFKQFIEKNDAFLKQRQLDLASVFVSERDGKPYVVLYGPPKGPYDLIGQPVVAYEQDGVNGKRFVANTMGAVEEVDEARFHHLVP